MATRLGTAYIPIEGDWSRFNRDVAARSGTLSRRFNKIGSDLGGRLAQGAVAATKVGLAGVAGGFVFAIKKAGDFESQLSSLSAVTSANADQMRRLREDAINAGAATKFSALEAAQAQTELAKGGLSVAQITKGGLNSALALAAAGEMNLADAASTAVNAMKLFGLRGKDAMRVADGFATAANTTTADVSDFAMALTQGGGAAKAVGLDFIETTAALEALAEVGVKGSDAGTSLKAALTQLASPTKKAHEQMQALGADFFDASGNMKPLADVSGILRDKLGGLTREQRLSTATTLVGTDGMRALLALYEAGPDKIARFERQLSKQGTAAQVAKTKQDNLKGSLEQLGGSLETLAITAGSKAIPTIRELSDDVTTFTNRINRVLGRNDLTFGQQINKIFDEAQVEAQPWIDKIEASIDRANIPDRLADAIAAGTPVIAAAAAQAGVATAKTFAGAFVDTNVWGKVVLGGLLLKKMGGIPAFTAVGRQAGAAMGTGMATGVAAGAGGLQGKLKTALGGAGTLAKRLVALDVAVNLIDARGNPIVAAANTAHDLTFGIVPKIKYPTADERIQANIDRVTKQIGELQGQKDFRGLSRLSAHIQTLAADARNFHNAKLGRTWDQLAADAEAAAERVNSALGVQWMRQIRANFRNLADGGKVSMDAIRNTVRTNMALIKDRLGTDSTAGRRAVSKNFKLAAKEIREQMDAGVISTKQGSALIRQYLRRAREAMGLTRAQAEAIRETGTLLNSEDRPGRSTILGGRGGDQKKAKKAKASGAKGRDDDTPEKKATKTVQERTRDRRPGGVGGDVDTMHVNRLVVERADGIGGSGGGGGGAGGSRRSRGAHSAADASTQADAEAQRVRSGHEQAVAVARARQRRVNDLRALTASLGTLQKTDENGMQLFSAARLGRLSAAPVPPPQPAGTPAVKASAQQGGVVVHQTFHFRIDGMGDERHLTAKIGREVEKRAKHALGRDLERAGAR